jgi:hypothetical protein
MAAKRMSFVQVTIRLGVAQAYEVLADADEDVKPTKAAFIASTAEGSAETIVLDILTRLAAAFEAGQKTISIEVDGSHIVESRKE